MIVSGWKQSETIFMEIWRDVVGYESVYQVSNFGRVRRMRATKGSAAGKVLKPATHKNGIRHVNLCVNSRPKSHSVHRLVALAFLGPPPTERHVVAHNDGNPSNNRLNNLRWATYSENSFDQVLHGTQKGKHYGRKSGLTDEQVIAIRLDHRTQAEVAKDYGISPATVGQIRRRETYKHLPKMEGEYESTSQIIRFTDDDVRAIRGDDRKDYEIAAEIGCSYMTIWCIKTKRSYAQVPDEPQVEQKPLKAQEPEEKNNIVVVGDLALIELTKGHTAVIDADDFDTIRDYKWRSSKGKGTNYACSGLRLDDGRVKTLFLHRLLMKPSKGFVVDHINGDGLDNRRSNLRVVTVAQNNLNSRVRSDSTTGIKGAYYDKRKGSYYSHIKRGDKRIYLGTFSTAEEAADAYAKASRELHGEFGRTYLDD